VFLWHFICHRLRVFAIFALQKHNRSNVILRHCCENLRQLSAINRFLEPDLAVMWSVETYHLPLTIQKLEWFLGGGGGVHFRLEFLYVNKIFLDFSALTFRFLGSFDSILYSKSASHLGRERARRNARCDTHRPILKRSWCRCYSMQTVK
jgi:hypothetical protein